MMFKVSALAGVLTVLLLSGCSASVVDVERGPDSDSAGVTGETAASDEADTNMAGISITSGTQEYRGFTVDSVLHDADAGDVHFSIHVPNVYNPNRPASLFVTLPGYQGLYFQGVGQNLYTEEFAFEALAYDDNMIVVAPQLNDWGPTSAEQTIALVEALMEEFAINPERVFIEGYSGGGETLSLVLEKRPELFAAAAHYASQWDGDLSAVAEARTPVRFVIGEEDEYYGPESVVHRAEELREIYEDQGLSNEEIAGLIVLDVKPSSYFSDEGVTNQHGGGAKLFAHDDDIMGWIFAR